MFYKKKVHYLNLLDRVSSVIESASTLSSNKLFFSRVRQGNVADLVEDEA